MCRNLCLVFALALACIQAQRNPPDYRSLQITVNQNQLSVLANYQNGDYQDQYQLYLYLRQNQQSLIETSYQYQAQTGPNQTQLQMQFNVNAILEYNSTEGHLNFEPNQASVSRYPELNQMVQWHDVVNETVVENNVPIYSFSWTTVNNVFTVRAHFCPRAASTDVGPLTPNDVKIDFEIHDYSFVGDQTRLALQTRVQSQIQSQNSGYNATHNDNRLVFGDNPEFPFGTFSWVPTAAGNGTINVVATTSDVNYANQFDIFFSFLTDPKSIHSDVVWDPKFGLSYTSPPHSTHFCLGDVCGTAGIVLVVCIVVVGLIVVGVGAYFLLGKKKTDDYERIQS